MLLLVHLLREYPAAFSLHPTHSMIWGTCHPFRVPGKLHTVSFWLDISRRETGGTLKAGNSDFFHLRECHRNHFSERTSSGFPHRGSARFPSRIAFWSALTYAGFGGFGSNSRHGEGRRNVVFCPLCLGAGRWPWHVSQRTRFLVLSC